VGKRTPTTVTGKTLTLDLAGSDGNAFVIMGKVAGLLKRFDRELGTTMADQYRTEAMSGDYDNLLKVTAKYVTLKQAKPEWS
jgi:hypothetical protein